MTSSARLHAISALEHWLGFAGRRLECLLHFMGLAATLAAAKVILSTVGVALFLAKEGPERLPVFYVLLALLAITLSFAFSGIVDRAPRIRLAQTAFFVTLLGAACLRVPVALEAPGVYYALLASAHVYEIVLDIVFWVVVVSFLDTIELKRGTPFIYMALAVGGAVGGGFTSGLSAVVPAEDLLLALPALGALAAAQFGLAGRRLHEVGDRSSGDLEAAGVVRNLRLLPRLIGRWPLVLLIALNALMLTILYGLSEYLAFTVYAAEFPDEAALTRFLAIMYALVQVLEFALLYAVSRPLLQRAGPLLRNLVFPLTSLGCLVALTFGHRLPAAIVTHLNAEAFSNAIFQPVNNTNYVALPLRYHGRVRTLADGIFYPGGLALAGVMLMFVQGQLALGQVSFIAIAFALIFVSLNVGVGAMFLPTLMRNLRSGVVQLGDLAPTAKGPPALVIGRVQELLRSPDPDDRAVGTALAGQLDDAIGPADVPRLAHGADRAMRRLLLAALRRAPAPEVGPVIDRLLASDDAPSQLLGLEAALARRYEMDPQRAKRLARSAHPAVAVLARIAAGRLNEVAPEQVLRAARDAESCAAVIAAVETSGRRKLLDLLVVLVGSAPLEQQREGLVTLRRLATPGHAPCLELARRLATCPDAVLRAEAIALLGALAQDEHALEEVARGLEDPSRRVRQRAADALARHGEAAIEPAAARLQLARPDVAEAAIWALGRIGSRRARDALADLLQPIYARAERNLHWLYRLPPDRDPIVWAPFEVALDDQNRRIAATIMQLLAALGEARLVANLRQALATSDQRTRANALEALISLPHRRFVLPILPLLEAMLLPAESGRGAGRGVTDDVSASILRAAARSADPWIRLGAAATARAVAVGVPAPSPFATPARAARALQAPSEVDMEQVLFLKRVPLFRYLPLDALLAVSRALERDTWLAGEMIFEAGSRAEHFCIVASGAVEIFGADGRVERVAAPGYFGELVLVEEATRSPQTVAAEDTALLRLHRIIFHDLSLEHPDILMELCRLLARRLRQAQTTHPPRIEVPAGGLGEVDA